MLSINKTFYLLKKLQKKYILLQFIILFCLVVMKNFTLGGILHG